MKKVYPERFILSGVEGSRRGFTLIELIVTITIVAILSAIGLTTYPSARKKAKDTQRQSDLNQYRSALETYASAKDGIYPVSLSTIGSLCGVLKPAYIPSCPADPSSPPDYGFYSSTDGGAYVLYAKLEAENLYWEICSDGRTGKVASAPTSYACNLP